jgi:hypothetical protein
LTVKVAIAALSLCLVTCVALALVGCDEPQALTEEPLSMDIYVDSTFSNDQVAHDCVSDIMIAVKLTAASRGFLEFHTFDGDPFRRRGLSEHFDEGVPANVEGTSGELTYLEDQGAKLEGRIKELIAERPVVGGSPLVAVLQRAARNTPDGKVEKRVLICTDGLFTDVTPVRMTTGEARSEGKKLGPNLGGATVDFIGLDASDPGRGRRIEDTKPLVEALMGGAEMRMGIWNVELGSEWRSNTIDSANRGI